MEEQNKKTTARELFLQFLEFGLFTFGGGNSIVAQIQKTYSEEKKLVTSEEILDITSVGRSLPGVMIGNVSVMFGYHMAGAAGAVACLLGMIIPPFCILWGVARFYAVFRTNAIVAAALYGIRAAVVPILLSAIIGMWKGAMRYPPCLLVTLLAYIMYEFLGLSVIWLVLMGIVAGFLITEIYERRAGK